MRNTGAGIWAAMIAAACVAAGGEAGWARIIQMQQGIQAMDMPLMMGWNGQGIMLPYADGPMMMRQQQEQRLREQITGIMDQSRGANRPALRRDAIENGLVGLGPQAMEMLRTEALSRTGLELDAFQGAIFRLANGGFDPSHRLAEWSRARFGYVPDPQKPFKPLPMETARVLNIPQGGVLFPHHVFYTVTWTPTHTRIAVAVATDGKVQALEDDAALLRFLRAEGTSARTDAGRELLASAALFPAIARTEDLSETCYPQTQSEAAAAHASLTAPVAVNATLRFSAGGELESVVTSRGN